MLKINLEFRELIPPLSDSEYAELEQSILAEGCRDPLCIWNDTIIDGHHRYEICMKHGLPFATREMEFESEDDAIIWILTNQLGRRNITDFTRIELALMRKDLLLAMGREKQKQTLKQYSSTVLLQNNKTDEEHHNTRNILATEIKISPGYIAKAEQIIKQAPEEVKEQLRKGDISISDGYKQIRSQEIAKQRQEFAEAGKDIVPDERWHIWQADIATWQAPKQYDFIITDPPYPKEYIYLYEVLAQRATEWLKPGGLLLAMCGESYLNQIIPLMDNHLEYYWTGCILTPGQAAGLWQKKVNTNWKPLLIYVNGEYNGKVFGDVFESDANEKDAHKWQQSVSLMDSIISKICLPGQSILDPFCGSGTTGIAALKHGCFFDGIDIDENNVNITKARIYDSTKA